MPKMKQLKKNKKNLVIFSGVALLIIIFFGVYAYHQHNNHIYQQQYINIYIDTNNQCGWSNGKIISGTNAIQRISTVTIRRDQLTSRIITAEKNHECLSTTYSGNY